MGAYKRIVGLAIGMSVVLAFGIANDILIRYFSRCVFKYVFYDTATHIILGFIENLIMSLLIGESLLKKNYKQYLPMWLILFVLDLLSTLFLFISKSAALCLAMNLLCIAVSVRLLMLYIKNTRYLGFLMLPVAVWYIYLFLNNYAVVLAG